MDPNLRTNPSTDSFKTALLAEEDDETLSITLPTSELDQIASNPQIPVKTKISQQVFVPHWPQDPKPPTLDPL